MCISPNLLSDGTLVACRKCWQCLEHRVDDWVGRCIAESKYCVASAFITLTYGRDAQGNESHERAAILTYSDVQKYMKQLRNRGLPCRYFAVGEYGSEKGRAHWHILAFFQEAIPSGWDDWGKNSWCPEPREAPEWVPHVWDKRFNCPVWPHGFSHWTKIQKGHAKGSIRYACKYINKDIGDGMAQAKYAMSKQPPLGARYFEDRAQKFVDEGISPPDQFYTFPDEARRKNGEIVRFRLEGKSLDLFCQHFIDKWRAQRGGHWPHSPFLDEYEDRKTLENWDREGEALEQRIRPAQRWPFAPPFGYEDKDIHWGDHGPQVKTETGCKWYGPNKEGKNAWQDVIPTSVWREKLQHLPKSGFLAPARTLSQVRDHIESRVFWMKQTSDGLGRWMLETNQANGEPAWRKLWSATLWRF